MILLALEAGSVLLSVDDSKKHSGMGAACREDKKKTSRDGVHVGKKEESRVEASLLLRAGYLWAVERSGRQELDTACTFLVIGKRFHSG